MKIFFTFIAKIKLYDPLEQFDTSGADKALASFYSYFSIPETTDQITANITVSLFILLLISYYVNFKKTNIVLTLTDQIKIFFNGLLNSFFRNTTADTIKYGILITSIFIIILLTNLLSLIIPTGETMTSHIILNFTMSFICIISMALRYIYHAKLKFFSVFVLQGVPLSILPFLVLIETISYLARLVSLAVRLFANITAGHVLVSLFGFVLLKLLSSFNLLSLLVIPFFVAILSLEFLVAFLQTYVFTVLLSSYLEEFEHHI
jgi:ATP synthase subunit 6